MAHRDHTRGTEAIDAPAGSPAGGGGETFKREGPEPATNDTGASVDEMNDKAGESLVRNVEPGQETD